jgi:hypothetical protein
MGRASGFGWRGTCSGVGGTIPAPAFPLGETGKGDQIPCCRFGLALPLSHALLYPSCFPITARTYLLIRS